MKNRDYYFDNSKFFLIFFVVFGHFIRTFINEQEFLLALYKVVYTFHMPAFIFVSGFFAKGYFQKGYIKILTKKLLLPYIIFQIIYSLYYYFILKQKSMEFDILNPHWSLWFLISLFFWNLMLPVFAKLKPSYSIIIAFSIGILVGYVDGISNYLSLSRTFVFFPFFLLGYFMDKQQIKNMMAVKYKLTASVVITGTFLFFYVFPAIDHEWLLGSKPYSEMDAIMFVAAAQRFFIYFLSIVMMFSFFSLVPNKQYSFTKIGKYTLYIYLAHGFIIKYFRASSLEEWVAANHQYWLLVLLSLLLTFILANKFIRSLLQPFVELSINQLRSFISGIKKQFLTS